MSLTWDGLHGVGELRFLRFSYVVLIGIPMLSASASWWNAHASQHWAELSRLRAEALSPIEALVKGTDVPLEELRSKDAARLRKWIENASTIALRTDLIDARDEASALLELLSWQECRQRLKIWLAEASRPLRFPAWGRFEFPERVKWLYLAMVLISLANLIYSTFCPPILRLLHQSSRDRGSGFGDNFDWCLSLYDQIKGKDEPKERIALYVNLLSMARGEKVEKIDRPSNNREWVMAGWMQLQLSTPAARLEI